MPSIDEIMKKREEKMAERPQFDGGMELSLRDDKTPASVAMAICHSLYSGQEGDPYLEYYIGHAYPAVGSKGGAYTKIVYCPVESGHDENYDCQGCRENAPKKDRFAMWLWVYEIMYNSVVGKEQYPPKQWIDGNRYFAQEINKPLYWETSAWKESPLGDIYMLAKQLADLRTIKMTLKSTGTGLDKRYKFYPDMGTPVPIDPALYTQAQGLIKPVRVMLLESITGVPTVQAQAETTAQPAAAAAALPAPTPADKSADDAPKLPPFKAPETPKAMF